MNLTARNSSLLLSLPLLLFTMLCQADEQGGGTFIAAGFPQHSGPKWGQNMQADYQSWLMASPKFYDQTKLVKLGPPSFLVLGHDDSADAVLTFRNVHNWLKGD